MSELDYEITSYRTCFSTDAGKRVLTDLLIQSGYFDTNLTTEGEKAVTGKAAPDRECGLGD